MASIITGIESLGLPLTELPGEESFPSLSFKFGIIKKLPFHGNGRKCAWTKLFKRVEASGVASKNVLPQVVDILELNYLNIYVVTVNEAQSNLLLKVFIND